MKFFEIRRKGGSQPNQKVFVICNRKLDSSSGLKIINETKTFKALDSVTPLCCVCLVWELGSIGTEPYLSLSYCQEMPCPDQFGSCFQIDVSSVQPEQKFLSVSPGLLRTAVKRSKLILQNLQVEKDGTNARRSSLKETS